jgi:hypothetical protein
MATAKSNSKPQAKRAPKAPAKKGTQTASKKK